jgi:hypothetical protein
LAEAVESEPIIERDDAEIIVEDFCKNFTESLEIMWNNGLSHKISEGGTIYTADIMAYYYESLARSRKRYMRATADWVTSTAFLMYFCGRSLSLERVADDEIFKVIEAFKTSAKNAMMDQFLVPSHLRQARLPGVGMGTKPNFERKIIWKRISITSEFPTICYPLMAQFGQ